MHYEIQVYQTIFLYTKILLDVRKLLHLFLKINSILYFVKLIFRHTHKSNFCQAQDFSFFVIINELNIYLSPKS